MTTAEFVNLIVKKLGGNRVEFLEIETTNDISYVEFLHSGNHYDCRCKEDRIDVFVCQIHRDQGPLTITSYSRWIEGVLNGKTRDDNGVLS